MKKNRLGTGVGAGHGGNTGNFPKIIEQPAPDFMAIWQVNGQIQPGTRLYTMGQLTIMLSPPTPRQGWHVTISHKKRYPTWDEVAHIRYALVPNELTMAMILPPREEYINIHNYCFQLHQVDASGKLAN